VDPVPDPLLLRKSGSAGNRTRDLCICSQKLWPLDHRGGLQACVVNENKTSENKELDVAPTLKLKLKWLLRFEEQEVTTPDLTRVRNVTKASTAREGDGEY